MVVAIATVVGAADAEGARDLFRAVLADTEFAHADLCPGPKPALQQPTLVVLPDSYLMYILCDDQGPLLATNCKLEAAVKTFAMACAMVWRTTALQRARRLTTALWRRHFATIVANAESVRSFGSGSCWPMFRQPHSGRRLLAVAETPREIFDIDDWVENIIGHVPRQISCVAFIVF